MNNDYKCLTGIDGGTDKVLSLREYLVPRWTRGTGKILSTERVLGTEMNSRYRGVSVPVEGLKSACPSK